MESKKIRRPAYILAILRLLNIDLAVRSNEYEVVILMRLLVDLRYFNASEPKDKIFALFGLTSQNVDSEYSTYTRYSLAVQWKFQL